MKLGWGLGAGFWGLDSRFWGLGALTPRAACAFHRRTILLELQLGNIVQLAYRTWGEPTNPPLLLLHGFMGCAEDWDAIANNLSAEFYCIAPDLPGHGDSPFDAALHGNFENYADAVTAFLDQLNQTTVAAIGYSMGGRILLALALRHPDRFSKIILESASPGIANAKGREARRQSDRRLADRVNKEALSTLLDEWYAQPLFGEIKHAPGYAELLRRRQQQYPHKLALVLAACGTGEQTPLWNELPTLKADTLLIYGERDRKYKEVTAEMQRHCNRLRTVAVAGCSHAAHVENSTLFIKTCRTFLVT